MASYEAEQAVINAETTFYQQYTSTLTASQKLIVLWITILQPVKVSELVEYSPVTPWWLDMDFKHPKDAWLLAGQPIPYPYNVL